MTKQLQAWPFGPNAVGFDHILRNLEHTRESQMSQTYPPYNIIKVTDFVHRIEIALAGFSQDDITITHEKNVLMVEGSIANSVSESDAEVVIHKGISTKRFQRHFTLGEHVQVTNAKMHNGLLLITCETIVPDEMKAKTINIS